MNELRVTFPNPCSKSWDTMQPRGCNRHCATCDTLVYDLASMTSGEVEHILADGKDICVRAEISPKGRVRTADSFRGNARPILACAGALLAAACQTTPGGRAEDGYKISGQVFADGRGGGSKIRNSEGQSVSLVIGQDGRFDVHGLRPGSYTIELLDNCGETHQITEIAVVDQDVDLGRLELETKCIIIGLMLRDDQKGDG